MDSSILETVTRHGEDASGAYRRTRVYIQPAGWALLAILLTVALATLAAGYLVGLELAASIDGMADALGGLEI